MKALSIRQPWAELILRGKKTLELRTWRTKYRGPLVIHTAQKIEAEACAAHRLDAGALVTGALVGTVELADVVELDAEAYAARKAQHLGGRRFRSPLYGWVLAKPQRLAEPLPMPGRRSLFEVELERAPPQRPLQRVNPERPFELRVVPTPAGETAYSLALYQYIVEAPNGSVAYLESGPPEQARVATLRGDTLRAVADQVLAALRAAEYKATDLTAGRREPFALPEETGVRLGLLFLAVRPISKMERVEAISDAVRAMPTEEAYYWYSKCTTGPAAERAQKALRVLLAAE